MTEITAQTVLDTLRSVVEGREDYKYRATNAQCSYSLNGEPRCIVGHVISILDPEAFEAFAQQEAESGTSWPIRLSSLEYAAGDDTLTLTWGDEDNINILVAAQSRQDTGSTWGEAVKAAEELAELLEVAA